MSRLGWGARADLLLAALAEHGPMTSAGLERVTGVHRDGVSNSMGGLRKDNSAKRCGLPKRVHVFGWTRSSPGEKQCFRPIYALGNLPCVPKPAIPPRCRAASRWARRCVGAEVVSRPSSHELLPANRASGERREPGRDRAAAAEAA